MAQIIDTLHPVGSIYVSELATNPGTLFGRGTWVAYGQGRVLIGNDGATFGTDGTTGGAATHSHGFTQPTAAAEAAHTHGPGTLKDATSSNATKLFTSSTSGVSAATLSGATAAGSSHAHTISGGAVQDGSTLPPYVVVHMWKRTA